MVVGQWGNSSLEIVIYVKLILLARAKYVFNLRWSTEHVDLISSGQVQSFSIDASGRILFKR